MKAQKKLNVLLVVLMVILLSLISFVGIFYQNKNKMESIIPGYKLGTDLKGYREITLEAKEDSKEDETEETLVLGPKNETENDSVNEVTDNSTAENEYIKKIKKSVEVFKGRLKSLKVEDYTISYDEQTGKIEMTIPEDERTDHIMSDITQKGEFKIIDTKTEEVLMSNKDISSVNVGISQGYDGQYTAYMSINFNLAGASKLRNITTTYHNGIVEENAETNEIEDSEEEDETAYYGKEDSEEDEEEDEESTKTVDMKIDDSVMLTTDFSSIIDSGVLTLSLGSSETLEELDEKLYGADNIAAIIENEPLQIEYDVEGNVYVQSTVDNDIIMNIVYVEIAIAALLVLGMVIKYRLRGILAGIISIGYLAILLLVIRYTNVTLSLEGIFAIEACFIINYIIEIMICSKLSKEMTKKEKAKELNVIIKKISWYLIPELIFAIICCLSNYLSIFSIGMVTFWGIAISWLYNFILIKFIA